MEIRVAKNILPSAQSAWNLFNWTKFPPILFSLYLMRFHTPRKHFLRAANEPRGKNQADPTTDTKISMTNCINSMQLSHYANYAPIYNFDAEIAGNLVRKI